MPSSQNAAVTSVHLSTTLTKINQARTRWGLASTSISDAAAGNLILSSHIANMKTYLQQAITRAGAPYNLNSVINFEAGKNIVPNLLVTLHDTAVSTYNYCHCTCDYDDCDCHCTCDYDNCCDDCHCTCDFETDW